MRRPQNLKKPSAYFDKTAVFTQQRQNKWEIFSIFCGLLRKAELYPNGASYLHMKHAHDMQNADTEYPFCWLEARHSSWLLAFFAIKLIHELSCIYQTYIIHNISKALDLQIKYTEIDLFFSIYPTRCIRMHAGTVWLCIFHSALQQIL